MSFNRNLKNQDFYRRLAIQDVLTKLPKKDSTGQNKHLIQDWTSPIFLDECIFQHRKTLKKTKRYIYIQNGRDEGRKNAINLPGVQIQSSITDPERTDCLSA